MPPKPRAEGSNPSAPAKENAVDTSSAAFIVCFTVLKLLKLGFVWGLIRNRQTRAPIATSTQGV